MIVPVYWFRSSEIVIYRKILTCGVASRLLWKDCKVLDTTQVIMKVLHHRSIGPFVCKNELLFLVLGLLTLVTDALLALVSLIVKFDLIHYLLVISLPSLRLWKLRFANQSLITVVVINIMKLVDWLYRVVTLPFVWKLELVISQGTLDSLTIEAISNVWNASR